MTTISPDAVAQDQIRAFVDRILRLKEEGRAITGDIKEVYAEAKGNGFDKTQLGKLVNYIEKRNADGAAVAEGEALFDLYLSAYDGVRASHAHAREDDSSTTTNGGDRETSAAEPAQHLIDRRRQDDAQEGHSAHDVEVRTRPVNVAEEPGRSLASVETPTESEISAPIPPPAEGNTPTSAGHGDESATHAAALVVATNVVELRKPKAPTFNDPAHRDCLEPGRCGGFSNLGLCDRCREAAESGQVA